ncbi:hypothetical protein [Devosia lucknowensis]|uniref:hypothetical protein n=1 Tax=Devosia lucknowensis TaxID=1096929 RepID=UPI00111F966F|nr:hypothetical protein [Devosia lucknowensis]
MKTSVLCRLSITSMIVFGTSGCASSLDDEAPQIVKQLALLLDAHATGQTAGLEEAACSIGSEVDLSNIEINAGGYSSSSRNVVAQAKTFWDLRRKENLLWERVLHIEISSGGDCETYYRLYGP